MFSLYLDSIRSFKFLRLPQILDRVLWVYTQEYISAFELSYKENKILSISFYAHPLCCNLRLFSIAHLLISLYFKLLPVLAANIGSLSSGLALGYSAVLLPQIRSVRTC